jgi:Kef-type K+ transport system membrane component KefB/nucleotide-binding universal stress UspA family protein
VKIVPINEHALVVFWADLTLLAVTARLFGALLRRFGQPAVVGELAAGVVLGPSIFGRLLPGAARWLFPPNGTQSAMIQIAGWLGIVMLLVITGFETDIGLVRQLGRAAASVATASILTPFVCGLAAGCLLPSSFLARHDQRGVFALFVATALSISSLPVIAKVLSELRVTRRNFGQLTLAAGMANDVAGWLLLGVIAGLARSGRVELGHLTTSVVGMVLFIGLMMTVGQRGVDALLRQVRARGGGVGGAFSATLLVALAAGTITEAIGVEAVLGAFVAGIVLGRSKYQDARVVSHLETATLSVLAPVFFALAGLRVDVAALFHADVLVWTVLLIAIASVGKFAGAYIGGRLASLPGKESFALGVGLNARGALEIVIATVGLSLGVLTTRTFTIVVVMAIVTSVAAPPMLRAVARRWAGTPEEQERLEREETLQANVLVRGGRLLVPVQRGDGSILAARVLDAAWPAGEEAVVVSFGGGETDGLDPVRRAVARRAVVSEVLEAVDPVDELVRHMDLGYGVVGIGAWEGRGSGELLSPLTAALLARTPLPTIVVWEARDALAASAHGFHRVVVPVVGTVASRAAQEVAFSIAAHFGARVWAVHVVDDGKPAAVGRAGSRTTTATATATPREAMTIPEGILAEAVDLGTRLGARPRTLVRRGESRAQVIVDVAEEVGADLVVLSAELQAVAGDVFLGNLVESVVGADEAWSVAVVGVPKEFLGARTNASPTRLP